MTVDIANVESTALAMCEMGAYDVVVVHDGESLPCTQVSADVHHRLPKCRVLVLGAERPKVSTDSEWLFHLAIPLQPDALIVRLRDLEERA